MAWRISFFIGSSFLSIQAKDIISADVNEHTILLRAIFCKIFLGKSIYKECFFKISFAIINSMVGSSINYDIWFNAINDLICCILIHNINILVSQREKLYIGVFAKNLYQISSKLSICSNNSDA